MLRLLCPNGQIVLRSDTLEQVLNRNRLRPVNYVFEFDYCCRATAVYRDGVMYSLATSTRRCTCPYRKYHRDCKHLYVARALEACLRAVECPDCEGCGYSDEDEDVCALCAGLGRIYQLDMRTLQDVVPAGR